MAKRARENDSEEYVDEFGFNEDGFEFNESDDEIIGEMTQSFIESDEIVGCATQSFLEHDTELIMEFNESDDELLGEMTQNFLESDEFIGYATQTFIEDDTELIGNMTQDFIEASQMFQNLPLYYQVGSGFETRPGPSSRGAAFVEGISSPDDDDLNSAIILEVRSGRRNEKYQANQVCFRARVDLERLPSHLRGTPLSTAFDTVRRLFELLIQRVCHPTDGSPGLNSTDLIRFCIQADGLDKPISTCLMPVSEMTTEKVASCVMKVLQSKDQIELDTGFIVDIITIRRDVGAGRGIRLINTLVCPKNKKSILSIPRDNEGLCCAKAIIYALAHLQNDKSLIDVLRRKDRPALMNQAKELHVSAQVPFGPCTYEEIGIFERFLNVQIVVFAALNNNKVSYKGEIRPQRINLYLSDNHYDVIKSLKGFFASNFYCESCEKPFSHIENHSCPNSCKVCARNNCRLGAPKRCVDCFRLCASEECFQAHKSKTGEQQQSLCEKRYQCRVCCKVIKRKDCLPENHRCWTTKCPSCELFVVLADHRCFLKIIEAKSPSDKLIFFDFETDQSTGEHLVNFAVAQYTNGLEKVFKGYSALNDFCSWLFSKHHKGFTAIAHNMKAFDGQFIMGWLLQQGTAPNVIPNGSCVMQIEHKALNVRIIDSINFLPMALSKLPSCFGLTELKKGYFPHLFNCPENQSYVGPLPEQHFYSPDGMGIEARKSFLEWYEKRKEQQFNFLEEMLAYCRSDVDILRRCCLEFRQQLLSIAKVDPFRYVTIASTSMAVFRSSHISPDTIAMVPISGYAANVNYSPDSIRWLDYVSQRDGISIKHALNGTGEQKIAGFYVDGLCAESKTIYQFHGCFYHGCDICFDRDVLNPLKGVTMASLRQKTAETTSKICSSGYTVVEMWEHEFKKMKSENDDLRTFLTHHKMKDRLVPRDAFFGGRTNAVKLYHEGNVKYVDFTSLYPWVNKYCRYPIGHPIIITRGFDEIEDYFGLIKCTVQPPRRLYFPVLPYRCQNKLMFPLCRTCAETTQQHRCEHTEEERELTGTWVTEELKLAVKKGYKIKEISEVYHFENTSTSLFKPFIDLFLKIKQESSGWPSECISEDDKQRYIEEYKAKEGVSLEYAEISKNMGRRQVAKLILNSFWGRWGMNCNKSQITYVNSLPEYNKMFADSTKKIKDVYLPNDEIAAIHWESQKNFVPQDSATNIFIAAFTTAWARMKLYQEMDKLGDNVLYHDTDSILYSQNGSNDPPLGNFLGEFTDELEGDTIRTFVSGGPKNYGYETRSGKTVCKVRGFTLNFRNSLCLNFETIKKMVCDLSADAIPLVNPQKICRDAKRRRVVNKTETKLYRVVYNKRVIQPDFTTLPYGY